MNLIPKICELLGVEVGEEFGIQEVESCNTEMFRYKYRFTQTELRFKSYDYWIPTTIPTSLLTGQAEIKKLPFEPKKGEAYFRVIAYGSELEILGDVWGDAIRDYEAKYCGNCFLTAEEAEKHKYEIYEKLTGKKWEEK